MFYIFMFVVCLHFRFQGLPRSVTTEPLYALRTHLLPLACFRPNTEYVHTVRLDPLSLG